MQIKLGIIGEQHAINSLKSVIHEYDEIAATIFLDEQDNKACEIISKHQQDVDVWLVFDQINYTKIENWGQAQQPLYYIPYRGASFYKVLCTALYNKLTVDELSIDTIPYEDIVDGLKDMEIPFNKLHVFEDDGSKSLADYINFHKQLYQQGCTKAAVTKSYYVKTLLEASGIKAFCILPMRVTIRNILNLILAHFHIWQEQTSQIAVQVFDFNLFSDKASIYSVDDLYSKEISITQKLLNYAKSINGSLKTATGGNFYIFTTRGNLDRLTNNFKQIPTLPIITELNKNLRACGIGLGKSASEAEYNAVLALKHASNDTKGCWYAVIDDKTISGPLGTEQQLDYQYSSPALAEISQKTSLSIATLSKICSTLEGYGRKELNAQELASTLQIQPRSARRILTILAACGYAEEIGLEMMENKGRPRKIYRINM